MIQACRRHWPLMVSVLLLWLAVACLLVLSVRRNQGHLVYAVDDAYIHMAMARNVADYGVWGVTRYEFSSSSSSLLWTSLLSAVYLIFGANEVAPLAMNIVFATLALVVLYLILLADGVSRRFSFAILLGVTFLIPLPAAIFCGMEHALQILTVLLFVHLAAIELTGDGILRPRSAWLWLLAPVLTLTRYEGLFVVAVVCLLLLGRRRWGASLSLAALAALPPALFGAVSLSNGWPLLPSSVYLKSAIMELPPGPPGPGAAAGAVWSTVLAAATKLALYPHMLLLLLAAGYLLRASVVRRTRWETRILLLTFLGASLVHVLLARLGHYHRYEAYLMALGLVGSALALYDRLSASAGSAATVGQPMRQYVAVASIVLFVLLPLSVRGAMVTVQVPQATANIYGQHYQMGLFLRRYYQGAAVAANDIGAINYLADIRCLDLAGLGSLEVAKQRQARALTSESMAALARSRGVRIAILYEAWYERSGGVPPQWRRVGQWRIAHNVVAAHDTVAFYAVDQAAVGDLRANLEAFAPALPSDTTQTLDW